MKSKRASQPVPFQPALVSALRGYTRQRFVRDSLAGLVVGVLALPLALAFAIASGMPPAAGLITAICAALIVSLLGGSSVQVAGPTGAFVTVIYGVVVTLGPEKLMLCTVMAGIILAVMGLTGMGRMIKFIPYPVTMGFTSGIAVIILSGQFKDLLGLPIERLPAEFVGKLDAYSHSLTQFNPATSALGIGTLVLLFAWPKRWSRQIPAALVGLAAGTLAATVLPFEFETIATRFGAIPRSLSLPSFPHIDLALVRELIPAATTIALLGAIESLLSAVVADGLTRQRHNSNQELFAQGIANIVTPLLGGIPSTGAIARTAANVRNGASSPVSGIVHSLTLFAIVMAAAPLAGQIPLCVLAAILVFVAWNMGEWQNFRGLGRMPRSDGVVFITTFALTIFTDLTLAVEIGMVLAAILFIRRVSEIAHVSPVQRLEATGSASETGFYRELEGRNIEVFRIQGPFFFGTADKLTSALHRIGTPPKAIILDMQDAYDIDLTGLNALDNLRHRFHGHDTARLVLCRVRSNVLRYLKRSGLLAPHTGVIVTADLEEASRRAGEPLGSQHRSDG